MRAPTKEYLYQCLSSAFSSYSGHQERIQSPPLAETREVTQMSQAALISKSLLSATATAKFATRDILSEALDGGCLSSATTLESLGNRLLCSPSPSEPDGKRADVATTSGTTMAKDRMMNGPAPTTTKGWTLESLVALGKRMEPVPRISALKGQEAVEAEIRKSEAEGTPLVIEDWHKTPCWPKDNLFEAEWLLEHGDEKIAVRDCVTRQDKEVDFKEFIEKCRTIPVYSEDGEKERLYGKDAVCPSEWHKWLLQSDLPNMLKPGGSEDVLELLPDTERVETLMCYHGIGDTFTAAHKDLCSSSGQNLMCATEKDGSAFWFMTASKDATRAGAFFKKKGFELDHEIYVASPEEFAKAPFTVYVVHQRLGDLVLVPRRSCHQVVNNGGLTTKLSWSRMTVEGLVSAFHHELPIYRRVCRPETYRVKLLVYRSLIKFTSDLRTLQDEAIHTTPVTGEASGSSGDSPRLECRETSPLTDSSTSPTPPVPAKTLQKKVSIAPCVTRTRIAEKVRSLLEVYDKILREDYPDDVQCELRHVPTAQETDKAYLALLQEDADARGVPSIPAPNNVPSCLICDFCGGDIFQSFFECKKCRGEPVPGQDAENIVICPGCFVEGRSCACKIMTPVQNYPLQILLKAQNDACTIVNKELGDSTFKLIPLSHQTMHTVNHPELFSAACQLLKIRLTNNRMGIGNIERSCHCRGTGKHMVVVDGALHCKKCHHSRCYMRIAGDGFHVSEALKWYCKDKTQDLWHSKHVRSRERKVLIQEALKAMRSADEIGAPCDMRLVIVENAMVYHSCYPISEYVKAGWYDDDWYFEETTNQKGTNSNMELVAKVKEEGDDSRYDFLTPDRESTRIDYWVEIPVSNAKRPTLPAASADVITVNTSDDDRQLFPVDPPKTISKRGRPRKHPAGKGAKPKVASAAKRASKDVAWDEEEIEAISPTSDGSDWLENRSKRRKAVSSKKGTSTRQSSHAAAGPSSVSAPLRSSASGFSPDFAAWANLLAKNITRAVTDGLKADIRLMYTDFANRTESKLTDLERKLDAIGEELREERNRNRMLTKEIEELKASRGSVREKVREPDVEEHPAIESLASPPSASHSPNMKTYTKRSSNARLIPPDVLQEIDEEDAVSESILYVAASSSRSSSSSPTAPVPPLVSPTKNSISTPLRFIASRLKSAESKNDVLDVPATETTEVTQDSAVSSISGKEASSAVEEISDKVMVEPQNGIERQSPSRSVTPLPRVRRESVVEIPRIRLTRSKQKRKSVDEPQPSRISTRRRKQA